MAGSQDYALNFFIKEYGKDNIAGIRDAIKQAADQAKQAKIESEAWGKVLKLYADDSKVSIGQINDAIKQQVKDLEDARRATEKLAAEEKKRYIEQLQYVQNRERNEAIDAANRAARIRAEDAAFNAAFGGPGGGGGGGASGGGAGSSLFGRVGGRILGAEVLGRGLGIPGGGFIGSQLAYGSGLSGGAALGLGAAAVGVVGAYALTKLIEDTTKYAQEQLNLARATGLTVQQTQALGKVSEITGTQASGLFTVLKRMNDSLIGGGAAARNVETGLKELGLSMETAFKAPEAQLRDLFGALQKISDIAERGRIIDKIFGSGAKDTLLAQVDKFERLYEISKQGVIDEKSLKQLEDFKEKLSIAKLEWEKLGSALSVKAVAVIELVFSAAGKLDLSPGNVANKLSTFVQGPLGIYNEAFSRLVLGGKSIPEALEGAVGGLFGGGGGNKPSGVGLGGRSPGASDILSGVESTIRGKERTQIYRLLQSSGGDEVERIQSSIANLDTDIKADEEKALGENGTLRDAQKVLRLRSQRVGLKGQLREAERLRGERERFGEFAKRPIESDTDALKVLGNLPKEFPDLINSPEYIAYKRRLFPIAVRGIQEIAQKQADVDSTKLGKEFESEGNKRARESEAEENRKRREQEQAVREVVSDFIAGSRTESAAGVAASRESAAVSAGFSRYGLTPLRIAAIEQAQAKGIALSEGANQANALYQQAGAARYGASQLPEGSAERLKLEQEAADLVVRAKTTETNAITKVVDSIIKFNESVDKAAERIRDTFSGAFADVVLGAQRGGGAGVRGALRGFAEGQEAIILRNIGEKIFESIKGPLGGIAGGLPKDLKDILKGTILEDPVKKINLDTTQIRKDLDEILKIMQSGGGGIAGAGSSNQGAAAGINAGLSSLGIPTGLGGNSGGSPWSVIFNNNPGSNGLGGIGSPSWNAMSVGGKIAMVGGSAALAAHGVMDITRGGAKNVTAGVSEITGAAAILDPEPISKLVLAGVAVVSGLVSSILGDSRQGRGNAISKQLFTQQYQAPQAINLSAAGNMGYSDFDTTGAVRTSNFSPYPVGSNSYLDVPRRTDVPGHTTSLFGGYVGTPSSLAPTNPQNTVVMHVHTMDAQSFMDNGGRIADALHFAISREAHPVVQALQSQMGLRG